MAKFNVGDKVRVIADNHQYFKEGHIFKVDEVDGAGDVYDENGMCVLKDRVELVESKPTKNQRITALENEVAELKLIVHELRERPQLTTVINNATQGPSTTNTVEDIIEFEGQQYRKVNREAKPGDVVNYKNTTSGCISKDKYYKVLHPIAWSGDECRVIGDDGDDYTVYFSAVGRGIKETDVYELIEPKPLTPNQQRFLTILNAKRFVAERQAVMLFGHADFIVNTDKRTIVALLKPLGSNQVVKRGITKCNPTDVFNEHIGKAIALGRALGLDVSEFEQAVQPTVEVGQIVEDTKPALGINASGRVRALCKGALGSNGYRTENGKWSHIETVKIINDTNAKYEVES